MVAEVEVGVGFGGAQHAPIHGRVFPSLSVSPPVLFLKSAFGNRAASDCIN